MDARWLAACLLLFLTAACPRPHEGAAAGGSPSSRDAGGDRRAWVGWRGHEPLVRACGSGASDPVRGVGQAACWRGGQRGPVKMTDDGFVRDTSPADHAPGAGCRIVYEEAADTSSPVRAWLVSSTKRELLDAWTPAVASSDVGYAIEASFSPYGALVALVHLRAKRGPSGTFVEVDDVVVRPAPTCP